MSDAPPLLKKSGFALQVASAQGAKEGRRAHDQRLRHERERVAALGDRIETERERFEDAPVAFGESDAHRETVAEVSSTVCVDSPAGVTFPISSY